MSFLLFATKKFILYYIFYIIKYCFLESQIRVNFIDFNCYCHYYKTFIVGKQFQRSYSLNYRSLTDFLDYFCYKKYI